MYRFDVPDSGMREVHWHPETAERGYVHEGQARMTILDPDGTTDTYLLKAGDAYFIPRAYPHHIEVLDEKITFCIFFDQTTLGDIGLKLVGSVVSRPLLAASLDVPEEKLPQIPQIADDPLVGERLNPRDPVQEERKPAWRNAPVPILTFRRRVWAGSAARPRWHAPRRDRSPQPHRPAHCAGSDLPRSGAGVAEPRRGSQSISCPAPASRWASVTGCVARPDSSTAGSNFHDQPGCPCRGGSDLDFRSVTR